MSETANEGVRLQKALANAGVASRRVCEQYIVEGRVRVNGQVVTELGTRIDPASDLVDVDGTAIQLDVDETFRQHVEGLAAVLGAPVPASDSREGA